MRYAQVKINSVDVSSYALGVELSQTRQELFNVDVIKVKLKKTVTAAQSPGEELSLELWGGETSATDAKLFNGTITSIKREPWGFEITGLDSNYQAVKRNVNKYYLSTTDPTAGNLREIVKDLMNTYAGLTADDTSVDDPGITITEFPCRDTDVSERVKVLGAVANFICYYDPTTSKTNWRVLKYTSNGNTIYLGGASNNVVKYEEWKRVTEGWLINKLNLRGSFEYPLITETFSGDGVTTEFTVTYVPETVEVSVGGTQQVGGKEGFSTGYDYTIRKEDKKIVFTAAPGVGVNNVSIDYSYKSSTPIQVSDEASITSYGIHETTITFTDIMNVADAEKLADAYVQAHKDPIRTTIVYIDSATFNTNSYELNDQLSVDDEFHNEMDGTYVITNTVKYWPDRPVKVTLSDKPLRAATIEENTVTRLKRLEELSVQSTDILTVLTQREHTITLERHSIQADHEFINDSFILGHEKNGLLGVGTILDDFEAGIATWSADGSTTLASDAVTFIQGAKSMSISSVIGGTSQLASTKNYGDVSSYTGVANGLPSQGTVGLWVYRDPASSATSNITFRLGSDSSNYVSVTGRIYKADVEYGSESTNLTDDSAWVYVIFRLSTGTVTGNPNWTACDYTFFAINRPFVAYFDYLTISSSNYIGLNGLGERTTTSTIVNTTY